MFGQNVPENDSTGGRVHSYILMVILGIHGKQKPVISLKNRFEFCIFHERAPIYLFSKLKLFFTW